MTTPNAENLIPVALCFGANLGDRAGTIRRAAAILAERGLQDVKLSSMLETAPWDCAPDAPAYVNAALAARTALSPRELLTLCLSVERELGRDRSAGYHADRTIDIDIALYGDRVISEADLYIPHPGVLDRDFFLIPLAEVASTWPIPATPHTVRDRLNILASIDCQAPDCEA